ncbi:gas vesicle protein [Streptomyces sp. NPDC059398]|uniref:gas vesicle protein GvpO n=1 Tax=Streptomyces sp. NPDC059398 TaxID=3346820 RepID=UPI0036A23293
MATTDSKDSQDSKSGERLDVPTAMRRAAGQLAELLQCEPSSVSALKASDDGWSADVEVVELEKIPDTASVMATYRVQLDLQGNLVGYERIRRYAKGQIDR